VSRPGLRMINGAFTVRAQKIGAQTGTRTGERVVCITIATASP
jgi:hypothetical protein